MDTKKPGYINRHKEKLLFKFKKCPFNLIQIVNNV